MRSTTRRDDRKLISIAAFWRNHGPDGIGLMYKDADTAAHVDQTIQYYLADNDARKWSEQDCRDALDLLATFARTRKQQQEISAADEDEVVCVCLIALLERDGVIKSDEYNGLLYVYEDTPIVSAGADLYLDLLAASRAGKIHGWTGKPLTPLPLFDFGSSLDLIANEEEQIIGKARAKIEDGTFLLPFPEVMFYMFAPLFCYARLVGATLVIDCFGHKIRSWTFIARIEQALLVPMAERAPPPQSVETFLWWVLLANELLLQGARRYSPAAPARFRQMKAGINAKRPLPPIRVIDLKGWKPLPPPPRLIPTGIEQQPHDRRAGEMHIREGVRYVPAGTRRLPDGRVIQIPEQLRHYKEQTVPRQAGKVKGGSKKPRVYKVET